MTSDDSYLCGGGDVVGSEVPEVEDHCRRPVQSEPWVIKPELQRLVAEVRWSCVRYGCQEGVDGRRRRRRRRGRFRVAVITHLRGLRRSCGLRGRSLKRLVGKAPHKRDPVVRSDIMAQMKQSSPGDSGPLRLVARVTIVTDLFRRVRCVIVKDGVNTVLEHVAL